MGQLICPGARLHKAHRFRFRGSERGRLRVMIPCWWGLPSSFQGGPWPGKAEERKKRLNAGDGGCLCWCGGKGADTSLPRQTWDIPRLHPPSPSPVTHPHSSPNPQILLCHLHQSQGGSEIPAQPTHPSRCPPEPQCHISGGKAIYPCLPRALTPTQGRALTRLWTC